jgi:hypothetical protein
MFYPSHLGWLIPAYPLIEIKRKSIHRVLENNKKVDTPKKLCLTFYERQKETPAG